MMLNQYGAQRFRHSLDLVKVEVTVGKGKRARTEQRYQCQAGCRHTGTIPIGSVIYIQDNLCPLGVRSSFRLIRREPWIVEAWLNREYHELDRGEGRCGSVRKVKTVMMLGGHLARVRSLRTGRVQLVADWILRMSEDLGGAA